MRTTTRYVHGPGIDEPLLVETGGQGLAVHADGLGSVTGLSDASQTLVEERAYTAFGRMQRSGSWPGVTYAYTGREWEPELGLYDYRARYYDPEAGRFLSRDPIGFAGGDSNLYAYVRGDAANVINPDGLMGQRPQLPKPNNCGDCVKYGHELQEHILACKGEAAACKTIEDEIRFMEKYDSPYMTSAIRSCAWKRFELSHPELDKDFLESCVRCVYKDAFPR